MDALEAIKPFITQHIHAVDQLEVLLLLWSDPSKEWTAAEIGDHLRTSVHAAQLRIDDLVAGGFLQQRDADMKHYSYDAGRTDIDATLKSLSSLYKTHRLAIISMIYDKPSKQVQSFLDAFHIRKKKSEE